jgi:hypothetical protein
LRLLWWWLAACALLVSCKDSKLTHGCREDKDCGAPASAYRCETQTGQCYCRTDDACPARQYCNSSGFCQDRSGCTTDADCTAGNQFCDTGTGTCLDQGRCTSDLHCPLGQVCDLSRSSCVEGCHFNGDCPGSSCRCGDVPCACSGSTPDELAKCAIGTCDPNFCSDNSFCRFGEQCGPPPDAGTPDDAGVVRNVCYSDFDPDHKPYCANCSFGGGLNTCGTGANYCLIDTANPGNYFCGVDCSQGQTCPRGYGCQDVIVVYTQWQCTAANPACPANANLPCASDADCKHGGTCAKASGAATGYCVGQCAIGEGDPTGFCTCQVDSDCAQESCSMGECTISRRKCVNDTDCRSIRCVDFDGVGGCLIGQNCAPDNGLTCLQVQ